MSGITQASLAGGALLVLAGLVAWRTQRARRSLTVSPRERPRRPAPEPAVVWLRPRDHQIVHAFYRFELRLDLPDVVALARCGRWPVAELEPTAELDVDEDAPRCVACERAVERMEHCRE